jgi:histidyl-tRNA synthetase
MPNFQTVRGTRDLLPLRTQKLRFIINKAKETAELYGYREVITPILESYELFNAKSGEEIRSRMFVFEDLGNRKVVLRPEFTASIARLVTTRLKKAPLPLKFFSVGTVYRYDEPQRGRYREFWQSNFELMGSKKPEADAEIILVTNRLMKKVKLHNYAFKLGHIGILRAIMNQEGISEKIQNQVLQKMDKKEYETAFELISNEHCKDVFKSLLRLSDRNRADSSEDTLDIITSITKLVQGYDEALVAVENLRSIVKLLNKSHCRIKKVDPVFARGLEYYTGMIFEVYIPELDIALGGGGRYDKLIETFGGEPTPAVGVAHGLDRIELAKQTQIISQETIVHKSHKPRIIVIPANEESKGQALYFSEQLRRKKIRAEFEVMGRTVDKALKKAKRSRFDYGLIVDNAELPADNVLLLDLSGDKEKQIITIDALIEKIKNLKKL